MSFDEQDYTLHQEITDWLWLIAFILLVGMGFAVGAMWLAERIA